MIRVRSVVFVTSLKSFQHLSAGTTERVGGVSEVGLEELSERRNAGSSGGTSDNLGRVGRSEENGGVNLEFLHVGVVKHTSGVNPTSLEWMSSNIGGMSMI